MKRPSVVGEQGRDADDYTSAVGNGSPDSGSTEEGVEAEDDGSERSRILGREGEPREDSSRNEETESGPALPFVPQQCEGPKQQQAGQHVRKKQRREGQHERARTEGDRGRRSVTG